MISNDKYNIDINNPFVNGKPNFIEGDRLLIQKIGVLLQTRIGSLVWDSVYGSRLWMLVGDNVVTQFREVAEFIVKESIYQFMGYRVTNVVFKQGIDNSSILMDISIQRHSRDEIITVGVY